MTTTQIRGVTLSAHAGMNMPECFPDLLHLPAAIRTRGDFARTGEGRKRRNDRRARIAAKAAWLNS